MQFGFNLPLSGPSASPAMLARLAAEGEAIGYDYAAISDHIVEPTDIHARYLARRAPRAADRNRLSGRQGLETEVPDLGGSRLLLSHVNPWHRMHNASPNALR